MKMSMVWILAVLLTVCLVACTASDGTGAKRSVTGDPDYPDLAQARLPQKDEKIAVIETNFGTMKILFFPGKSAEGRGELFESRREGVLQQYDLAPHYHGFYDAGG